MLLALLSFFIGALVGFVGGVLVVRKHFDKLKATESEGRKLLDALKGK